jgi:hypothetical protein
MRNNYLEMRRRASYVRPATLCYRRSQAGAIMSRHGNHVKVVGWRAAAEVRTVRANERAAKLDPVIKALQARGVTTLTGIAEALNKRRISTPRGVGQWHAAQVRRLLKRLAR